MPVLRGESCAAANAMLTRSEIYKTPRPHEEELCRPGDLAEVRRSHCTPESGLLVQVMGEPHFCFCMCAECGDRKSTRLNSSHQIISYAVFCLKKKKIRHCPHYRSDYGNLRLPMYL